MRKRIISIIISLGVILGLTFISNREVDASSTYPMLDGSYLTHDDESEGEILALPYGMYLQTGYSKIGKIGDGLIAAGGSTIAQMEVDEVYVGVIIERTLSEKDPWERYDFWSKTAYNARNVNTSERREVEGGYYYRVICTHVAHTDMGTSFTDGIYVE